MIIDGGYAIVTLQDQDNLVKIRQSGDIAKENAYMLEFGKRVFAMLEAYKPETRHRIYRETAYQENTPWYKDGSYDTLKVMRDKK